MIVSDLFTLNREISPERWEEYEWYCGLNAEITEFGYMVTCDCGVGTMGYLISENWIREHFLHRNAVKVDLGNVLDWLDELCESEVVKLK